LTLGSPRLLRFTTSFKANYDLKDIMGKITGEYSL